MPCELSTIGAVWEYRSMRTELQSRVRSCWTAAMISQFLQSRMNADDAQGPMKMRQFLHMSMVMVPM